MQKAIEVTNLCKRYSQEVLKNFSLSVNEGEMVVLLGESGCGKSTFIRILAGLENADSGSVCLNGISMDERIPPNKRNIALVYQEPVLWNHMPVWKNIAYGMAKKDKNVIHELMDALEIGGLEKRFPEEISGGQAKRLALARTLCHKKPILILDDPFSALDRNTEDTVFADLQEYAKDKVVFLISHRLYHFPQMRKIIFMEDGKTVVGTHAELMRSVPAYRLLYESQTGGNGHEEA
mgnify:CR=1 FL=1